MSLFLGFLIVFVGLLAFTAIDVRRGRRPKNHYKKGN
jgi:hypothetical protein